MNNRFFASAKYKDVSFRKNHGLFPSFDSRLQMPAVVDRPVFPVVIQVEPNAVHFPKLPMVPAHSRCIQRDIRLIREAYDRDGSHSDDLLMPTALPGTSFFLNMPFAPARQIIASGLPLATASDYNPGSTPSGDMKFVVSLACIKMRLLPEEAINAATINTAAAMGISRTHGSITRGKVANLIITEPIPSLAYIPYAYTQPIVSRIVLNGDVVKRPE